MPSIYDIAYDPLNNLLYTTGRAAGVNLNPFRKMYAPENQGDFFAAYNDQGILQFAHPFSTSTLDNASKFRT